MTRQTSSDFLYNALTLDNLDTGDSGSSEIKLETHTNLLSGKKRKHEVKPEPHEFGMDDSIGLMDPPMKKARLTLTDSLDTSCSFKKDSDASVLDLASSNNTQTHSVSPRSLHHNHQAPPQYIVPVVPSQHPPHPQYFVPMIPHTSPYGAALPYHPLNSGYMYHPSYGQFHPSSARPMGIQKEKKPSKRKRGNPSKNSSTSASADNPSESNPDSVDEESSTVPTKIMDRSPFKTTYVSHEEEIELKNTNSQLYSQFHHARQAIYQQYKQKTQSIRHSSALSPEKRKLNMKMAAIDAKVQEKKLFLSYLDMSKPQPNSWLVSNSALSMNAFARKITHQTQAASSYSNPSLTESADTAEEKERSEILNKNKKTCDKLKHLNMAKRVKKPKFSEYNVRVLRDWYETHTNNPYPSSAEKQLMCQLTGLTKYQVSRWFCNVRTRKPPPELSDNDEDLVLNVKRKGAAPPVSGAADAVEYNDYPEYFSHPMPYHPHPSPLNIHMQHMPPMNMPPLAQIPMNSHPINMQHFNFNPINIRKPPAPPNNDKFIDQTTDNSEGLMPSISSDFSMPQTALLPPLLDEDSNQ